MNENKKKMVEGLLYDCGDPEILSEQLPFLDLLFEFNKLKPSQIKEKEEYMKKVFAECGDNNYIELPFRANWGGHHVHLGNNVYINFNATFVDDGHIYIGDHVMIGPNVTIITASHPLEAELRNKNLQYNKDVHIESSAWIGANVVILPGITIGKNSVVGAGSVVTKDIPDDVVAFGNPARIHKSLKKED